MRSPLFPLFIFAILCSGKTTAQTEVDTSFQTQINRVFANVNKSLVPHGILKDYAMEFINLNEFNGATTLADSNATRMSYLFDVYYTLFTGRINNSATGFVHPDTINNRWSSLRDTGKIVLSGLLFNYSRFKDDAADNYITVSGGQLFDKYVSGVWQNPYVSELAFILSPPVNKYSKKSMIVVIPSTLWFSNTSFTSLEIDFDDGIGYRTIALNTPVTVSYVANGYKNWKFKLTMPGGTKYAHTNFLIGPVPDAY